MDEVAVLGRALVVIVIFETKRLAVRRLHMEFLGGLVAAPFVLGLPGTFRCR